MAIWIKPSGLEMEVNDRKETIKYVESLGWEKKVAPKKPKPKLKEVKK